MSKRGECRVGTRTALVVTAARGVFALWIVQLLAPNFPGFHPPLSWHPLHSSLLGEQHFDE